MLQRTTAFGYYDDDFVLALEKRTDHLGLDAPAHLSRQRLWRIRPRHVVLATGAHERPLVFADNDRPGIMLAAVGAHLPAPLRRAAPAATSWSSPPTTAPMPRRSTSRDAGVTVRAVVDARPEARPDWAGECAERGIEVRTGTS